MMGEAIEIIDTPKVEIIDVEVDGASVIEVIEQGPIGPVGPQGPAPDLSSPPPIGDVTPNTGDFTNLSASENVTASWITSGQYQAAEIYLNDTTGDIAINAYSGAGTISLVADNTIGEDIQADKFSLNTSAAAIAGVGEMAWNDTDGTIDLGLKGGNSTLQLGQELVLRVKNDDSVQLTDGMVVYVSGANGTNLLVKRAEANAELTSASTIGVVTEPISVNGHGYITTFGVVRGINTNGFNAGDILYLSPSVAGELTNVKPTAPNHMVMVGFVVKKSAGSGEVFVQVQNGYELEELHDVSISGASAGQVIRRNAGNTLWENHALTPADIGAATAAQGALADTAVQPGSDATFNSVIAPAFYTNTYPYNNPSILDEYGLTINSKNSGGSVGNSAQFVCSGATTFGAITLTSPSASGTLALTSDIPTTFAASAITSGTLDNARINWAAPSAIGGTTAAAGTFTSLAAKGLSLAAGTITASAPFDFSQTWNNAAVTFTGLKLNVTDTASAAASLFFDFQVGGTSKVRASKAGTVYGLSFSADASFVAGGGFYNSLYDIELNSNGLKLGSACYLSWYSGKTYSTQDLTLLRDAANTLAQRNGTNAQEFRIYNTYTSATNYQRGTVKCIKQTLSALSGASATTTGTFIPDGAVVVGVTTRVGTAITGATSYSVGDGSDVDRWGGSIAVALNTTSDNRDWTAGTVECFTSGGNVTLTANGSNFTGGAVEICVFYLAGEAD